MGFQRVINQQPAPAVQGDFASNNPFASILSPVEQGLQVAAGQAVTVGYFAWAGVDGKVYSSAAAAGEGAVLGFVGRQANIPASLITEFLGESRLTLLAGMGCTLFSAGDFWTTLKGADPGDVIYAVAATGAPTLDDASAANPDTGFVAASQSKVDAVTANTTTIAANTGIMTIATLASGVVEAGQKVTGTGVPAETYIVRQLTGSAGAAGTYQTNSYNRAAVSAFTATMTQGSLIKISKAAA